MESTIDIASLKSAEVVDDPEQIAILLESREAKVKEAGGREAMRPTTSVERDEDGRAQVRKDVSVAALDSLSTLPEASELQRMAESVGLEWQDELAERVIPYWASDERVDRHGDIVRQQWVFDSFRDNPVVPYSHSWDMPPVGNTISWQVARRTDDKYDGPALHLLNLFAPAAVWEFADTIYRLVKSGFLKASSVGFYPQVVVDVKDSEERDQLGLGRFGLIFDKNELVEHSPTTVPANPGAVSLLRSAKTEGQLKAHDILLIRDLDRQRIKRGRGDSTKWKERDAMWRSVWSSLFPDARLQKHDELDVPVVLDLHEVQDECEVIRSVGKQLEERMKNLESTLSELLETVDDIKLDNETLSVLNGIDEGLVDRMNKAASSCEA